MDNYVNKFFEVGLNNSHACSSLTLANFDHNGVIKLQ